MRLVDKADKDAKTPTPETVHVQQVYANNASIEVNVYDFALIFGISDSTNSTAPVIAVRMSPQHAKSVALLLERFLTAYEAEVGPIPLPELLVNRLKGENNDAPS